MSKGHAVSRLESFSDAVFAFSATLLVVSLEVPRTFGELAANMYGFIPFGLTFGALILIWSAHNRFFRRYGLRDTATVALNSILLFVVLFYVYPLKFVASSFVGNVLGLRNVTPAAAVFPNLEGTQDLKWLFVIYGVGFVAVFGTFVLLYRYAMTKSEELDLDGLERFDARTAFQFYLILVAVGLLSIVLAFSGFGTRFGGLSGWIYGLLGPLCAWHGYSRGTARDALSTE